jgi:hypothetical protein
LKPPSRDSKCDPHSKKPCHAAAEFDAWNHGGGFLPLAMQAKQEICYWKAMPDAASCCNNSGDHLVVDLGGGSLYI